MVLCSTEASVKKRNVDDRRAGLLNGGGGGGGGSGERKRRAKEGKSRGTG